VTRVLVVDNYDSFVYNLVQYLGQLGAEPLVRRNDGIGLDEITALQPDGILVSPGPGRPEDADISVPVIRAWAGRVPLLGVCLGHQAIAVAFGGSVVRAPVMHGKTSTVAHDRKGIFEGMPEPFVATRYHSLVVADDRFPDGLEVSARSEDGTIMGVRSCGPGIPVEGVQFHPESILTEGGHRLVGNWLAACRAEPPSPATEPTTGG
jgi:para-aminobenzoate synthetase component 2